MTKLQGFLIAIGLARGLSEVCVSAMTAQTVAKIRQGLSERQRAKHYRWIEFQRDLHPPLDARALVRRHCGLSDDDGLDRVQQRAADLLAGARLKARKNFVEIEAIALVKSIEIKQLPKSSRGRPNGTGKAHPVELYPPGTNGVIFLDVHLTVREVIEVVVPIIEDHAGSRIDVAKGSVPYEALVEALLAFVPEVNRPSQSKKRMGSITREITAYFSARVAV